MKTPNPPLHRIGLALLSSSLCTQVFGQVSEKTTVQEEPVFVLPTFTVSANPTDRYRGTTSTAGARISGNVMEIAGSISILTPEFLGDLAPTRVFDATRYVAGVSEGQGDGFWDRQYIRGFQDNRPSVDNFASVQSENVDPLFIDHIEVVKGPSAILAPTGTPGGLINIINKTPQLTASRSLTVEVGRIDSMRASLDLTGPLPGAPKAAYRVLAGWQDGPLNTSGTRDRRKVFGLQLAYHFTPQTQLLLRQSYEDRWRFVYFPAYFDPDQAVNGADGKLAPGFKLSGSRNGTESWAHRGGRYYTTDLLLTSSLGDHLSVRFASKYQMNKLRDAYMFGVVPYDLSERYNPYTGILTPNEVWSLNSANSRYEPAYSAYYDPANVVRQPRKQDEDTSDFSHQLDIAAQFRAGPVTSTTVLGAAYSHASDTADYFNAAQTSINLLAPVYGYSPDWGLSIWSPRSTSDTDEQYLRQQFGFLENRIIASAAAVRIGSTGTNYGVRGDYISRTTPQFGLVWKALPTVSVYASRSENTNPGYPNGTLLWQDGRQNEVGLKTSFLRDRLALSAAYFEITQGNISVANPAFQGDPLHQPRYLISNAKEHGTEFEATGALTPTLSIMGSLTLLHQRDSLGRHVIMVPDTAWALLLSYKAKGGCLKGFSTFVGTHYTGRVAGDIPSPDFTVLNIPTQVSYYLASRQLWSLGARYSWKQVSTSLNIDNLFDKKYITLSSGRFLGGVGTPFNIRLTTTYSF